MALWERSMASHLRAWKMTWKHFKQKSIPCFYCFWGVLAFQGFGRALPAIVTIVEQLSLHDGSIIPKPVFFPVLNFSGSMLTQQTKRNLVSVLTKCVQDDKIQQTCRTICLFAHRLTLFSDTCQAMTQMEAFRWYQFLQKRFDFFQADLNFTRFLSRSIYTCMEVTYLSQILPVSFR